MAANEARGSSSKAAGRHGVKLEKGKGKEVTREHLPQEAGLVAQDEVNKVNRDRDYFARSREVGGTDRPKGLKTGAFEWQSTNKITLLPGRNDNLSTSVQNKEYVRDRKINGVKRTEHIRVQTTKRREGGALTDKLVRHRNDVPNMQPQYVENAAKYHMMYSEKRKRNTSFRAPPKEEGIAAPWMPEEGNSKAKKRKLKELGL